MNAALQLATVAAAAPRIDLARLHRETAPLTYLHGPGTAAVRAAARQLLVALDLLQQQQRREGAEVLRLDAVPPADAPRLLTAAAEEDVR